MTLEELKSALQTRIRSEERALKGLVRERAALESRLTSVSDRIAEIEETIGALRVRRRPGRPRKQRGPGRPKGTGAAARTAKAPAANGRRRGRRGPGRPPGTAGRGAAAKKGARRRPTFRDLAVDVLRESGKPLHQRDIARLLKKKKGVKSRSKAFDRSLGLVLAQDKRFRKVARATYALA